MFLILVVIYINAAENKFAMFHLPTACTTTVAFSRQHLIPECTEEIVNTSY